MSKPPKELNEAKNWYKDRYQYVLVQRKLLTGITLLSLLCTLVTVIVIARLGWAWSSVSGMVWTTRVGWRCNCWDHDLLGCATMPRYTFTPCTRH